MRNGDVGEYVSTLIESPLWLLDSVIEDCTADGAMLVSAQISDSAPYGLTWDVASGYQRFFPGERNVIPTGVSADGSVIAGYRAGHAFQWTSSGGPTRLPQLDERYEAFVDDLSSDGMVAVGGSYVAVPVVRSVAVRWVAGGPPQILADASGSLDSRMMRTNRDGSAGCGGRRPALNMPYQPFYWTETGGMISLPELLVRHGLSVPGWEFDEWAPLVSDDGTVLAGSGRLNGAPRGWAIVGLPPVCRVDLDLDGETSENDLAIFTERFISGSSGPSGVGADINGDGFVDWFDYDAYVELYERGC